MLLSAAGVNDGTWGADVNEKGAVRITGREGVAIDKFRRNGVDRLRWFR